MTRGDEIAARFGQNLRRARRDIGLSQEDLAAAAGMHRTEVFNLEHGHRKPRIDTVIKLACSLGVPIDQLVDGINWVPHPPEEFLGGFRIAPPRRRPVG